MVLLLALTGCIGTLSTSEGPEPLRAALWFPDSPVHPAVVPYAGLLLLANSPLRCEAEAVDDDPDTPEDEQASALVYWQGEIASAFTREDAWIVLLSLYSRGEDREGTYTLTEGAATDAAVAMAADAHAGFGAWLHIEESSVDDLDGLFYVYEPQRIAYNQAVQAPASATIEEREGGVSGRFSFGLDDLSGTYRAEECANAALLYALWNFYAAFPALLGEE